VDERLDAIEARLTRLEALMDASAKPAERAPVLRAPIPPVVEAYVPPREQTANAEDFFGGRVFLAVGALALLFGVAFFIKYAFDNGWIGPTGRVVMGLLAGVALLAAAERMRRTSKRFAEGITGLGGALLYLSLWAAGNGFHLVPVSASFIAMALVTAALVALAVRHDSEITAGWALAGGFITPLLNATDSAAWTSLFTYIAILDAALVLLPATRRWPRIQLATFVFSELYLAAGLLVRSIGFGDGPTLATILISSSAYLGLFVWQPIAKAVRQIPLDATSNTIVVASAIAYYASLHVTLYDRHRLVLTAAVVVLAAGYVALANIAKLAQPIFSAIALALVTGGVAITFTGHAITALWALEGAVLAFVGLQTRLGIVRLFAAVAFGCALLHLAIDFPEGGAAFRNDRFVVLAIVAASFFGARAAFARWRNHAGDSESAFYLAAEALGNVFVLAAFSLELYSLAHQSQLPLTLFWLLYGAALLALGVLRHAAFTRLEGFVSISLAVFKAFLVDLSEVDPGVRIVSFLALGVVLLGISYAYLRAKRTTPEHQG
jgi:uncharacterized membrane protein